MPAANDEVPDRAESTLDAHAAQSHLACLGAGPTAQQLDGLSGLLLLWVVSQISYEEAKMFAVSTDPTRLWSAVPITEQPSRIIEAKAAIAATLVKNCLGGE